MNRRTTINDIAKALQITAATVSRALSDHPEISAATKKKVRAEAERLDYTPNKVASSLRSGKTKLIGVLIPTAEHSFFGSVIHGISNMASKKGYDVLIYQSNESQDFEKKGMETFISARVDGILASVAKDTTNFSHFIDAKDKNIPIAFFDRVNDEIGISSVVIDDYQGAYLATSSLIKAGYQRIAHISGPKHIKTFSERTRGYKDALETHGHLFEPELVYQGDISIESGRAGAKHFLASPFPPDALFAVEDFTALGVLKELKTAGIQVPGAFGVFGFCNDLFGEHITPSLSTVDQKTVQMGEVAFQLIHELIGHPETEKESQKRVLQPLLIVRESSEKKQVS